MTYDSVIQKAVFESLASKLSKNLKIAMTYFRPSDLDFPGNGFQEFAFLTDFSNYSYIH